MRLSKTIDFGEGRYAILKEATVAQVRNILKEFKENGKFHNQMIVSLLADHASELVGLVGDCITLQNCQWDDLTYSEIMQVWEGLKSLLPFLSEVEKLIQLLKEAFPTILLSTLSKPTSSN